MKLFIRHTLALAAALTLAGPSLLHAAPPASTSEVPEAKSPAPSAMDARLFYEILVGEMSAQRNDFPNAYGLLMDAARRTQSPKLFARATAIALMARDGHAALTAVRAWRRTDPTSREAARLELQVLVGMNRMGEAVDAIRSAIELSPEAERPAVILALPVAFMHSSNKVEALQTTEKALTPFMADAPTRSAAWVTLGRMHLGADNKQEALKAARTAHEADPKWDAPPILALELLEQGLDEAEPLVTDYLAKQSSTPVRMHYAKLLMDAKRSDDAFAQLKLAVEQDPKYADSWLLLSDLYLQRKQLNEAQHALGEYLRHARQSGPAGGTPRGINVAALQLAEMAARDGRKADAQTAIGHIIHDELNLSQTYRLAKLQMDLGQSEQARQTLEQLPEGTVEERKNKALAQSQLLRETGDAKQAYTHIKALLDTYPSDTEVLYDAALTAEKADDFPAMERHLRKIIELDPKHFNALNALGYAFADRNIRLDEARQLIEQALALSPDSLHIQDSMAWLQFRLGNHRKALEMLEQIYEAFPDGEIAAHLGEVLWATGAQQKARALWRDALRLDPGSEVLRQTIQRLTGGLQP